MCYSGSRCSVATDSSVTAAALREKRWHCTYLLFLKHHLKAGR